MQFLANHLQELLIKIAELEQELVLIEERDKELRTYAAIPPLSEDIKIQGTGGSVEEIIIEDNDDDGLGGTLSVYNGCMNDVSVELYYLDGLGHQWPSLKGTRVFDIDSASVIWEFFSKYNVDGLME